MEKERVEFPAGKQAEFIKAVKVLSKCEWKELEAFFGIPYNKIQTCWKENNRLSYVDFKKICGKLGFDETYVLKEYEAKKTIWKPEKAFEGIKRYGKSKSALNNTKIKFGRLPESLDLKQASFSETDLKKKLRFPERITAELAEETGMHLGDGFLSGRKYEYRLKGNKKDEREYYEQIIAPLFKKLYGIDLKLKEYETTFGFELFSKAFWEFKTKVIGLQCGKKENISIPEKFKVNDSKILSSLVRGYFDTDGCVYFRSQGKNKNYYPVISVTSSSECLINDFFGILEMLGFKPNKYKNKGNYSIFLYGYANFKKYNELIGWHSPKHLGRIKKWSEKNKELAEEHMAAIV